MTRVVHVARRGVRSPLSAQRIAALAVQVLRAERVRSAELSITLVTTPAIAFLNARHLGHRGATDVIAFPFAAPAEDAPVVGDIYIAPGVARANARRHAVSAREELARLVVHGTLHVLGHEHPDDRDARLTAPMWRRQEQLLRRFRVSWQ